MNHLKTYENYSELNELRFFKNDERTMKSQFQKFEAEYSQPELFELLFEYINLNIKDIDFQFPLNDTDFLIDSYKFIDKKYNKIFFFYIYIREEHQENVVFLTREQIADLLIFLKNPDLYRNTKKYNL